ncbi:normocyte-binding protein [Paenibacillus sp. NPDC058071]|uniref:normocyte-binding protein n=1 Tax=Paenibacillus sp. NPDC058071 TaxID=3346326 RepID=UPI0036DF33C9
MKDIVADRLSRMEDLEQRKLLKQLMNGLFNGIVEYQEQMNETLERRIFEELEDDEDKHDIFATVCRRDDIDPIHDFLYPMLPEDAAPPVIELNRIIQCLGQGEEMRLHTLFMQCSHSQLNKLLAGKRTFRGVLETTGGACAIEVRVARSSRYTAQIERLYDVFQQNGVPWKTVNHPYAYKFVDLILTGSDRIPESSEEVLELRIDLEHYDRFKRNDIVPLWNIERLELKNSGFPVPAADRINFEHVMSLRKTGASHGYLVDGDEENIRYIKRSADELTVVSPQERSGVWNVWKLTQPGLTPLSKVGYPLYSNRRKEGFIGKYARKQAAVVRATGELMRVVHSFEAAEVLELAAAAVDHAPAGATAGPSGSGATYGMNPFISDNIRSEAGKKRLKLTFRPRGASGEHDYLLSDLMSFLVSEIQMYFPEYRCEGEWA